MVTVLVDRYNGNEFHTEGELRLKDFAESKQLDTVTKRHHCSCNVNATCCRNLFTLDIGAKQYCFSLSRVEKQPILQEPARNVINTFWHGDESDISSGSNSHVQLRVVGVLMLVQIMRCEHITDRWDETCHFYNPDLHQGRCCRKTDLLNKATNKTYPLSQGVAWPHLTAIISNAYPNCNRV